MRKEFTKNLNTYLHEICSLNIRLQLFVLKTHLIEKLLSQFLYIFLISTFQLFSQVTTSPVVPTSNDEITITFDTTNTGLDGYTGDVYAHTGVITTNSTSNTDWKYVIGSWGNNVTQPQLTRLGDNSYQLIITQEIATYYSSGTDVVTDIAVVFRNSTGNAQSRPDVFIPIYAAGLNVAFTNAIPAGIARLLLARLTPSLGAEVSA